MYHMFCIDGGLDIKVCIFEWMIKWINAVPVIGFNHTTHRKYLFTQMSLSERIWEPSYNSPMPMLCSLYGMLLASLLHRMPRIWSLSWLWRPGGEHFPHCVPSFPSGTICCLSSPLCIRLAASAEWPAAWGSTVQHVCTWALWAWSMCVWRVDLGLVGCYS